RESTVNVCQHRSWLRTATATSPAATDSVGVENSRLRVESVTSPGRTPAPRPTPGSRDPAPTTAKSTTAATAVTPAAPGRRAQCGRRGRKARATRPVADETTRTRG